MRSGFGELTGMDRRATVKMKVSFFALVFLIQLWGGVRCLSVDVKDLTAGDVRAFIEKVRTSSDPGGKARIINGEDAPNGSFPHQVSMQWVYEGFRYHICGGSVIAKNVVLTAAHCVDGFLPTDIIEVSVYDNKLFDLEGMEQRIRVTQTIMYHDYFPSVDFNLVAYPHDIALMILAQDIKDDSAIIEVADESVGDLAGQTCTISGWGLNDTDHIPNNLQMANMTVLSRDECMVHWGQYGLNIFDGHICIFRGSNAETGAASCSGDSGGPLVCNGVLAGVTSWGYRGCRLETGEYVPSVYARVSYYYPWLEMMLTRFGNPLLRGR